MKSKYNKGFTPIKKVLPDRIKEYKLEKSFYRHQALRHWETAVCKFLDKAGRQTRAVDLKNGVLLVACLSKDLAYQIRLLAQRIVDEINQLIGKSVVFAIYTEV